MRLLWYANGRAPGMTMIGLRSEPPASISSTRADDHVSVEVVLVIEPRQCAEAAGALELREAVGEGRPDHPIEIVSVDLEVVSALCFEAGHSAGVAPALRAEREPLRILEIRQ